MIKNLFVKFRRDPLGFVGRALYKTLVAPRKYWKKGGYDAGKYWRDRFSKHGMSLQSVGDEGLSIEENREMYEKAATTFLNVCKQERIDFTNSRVLEIGCGNGFYTEILWQHGVRNYCGVDITDVFFPELKKRFPTFEFVRGDITADAIAGEFDLILMIDVIEHIVAEKDLDFAMMNVQSGLGANALLLLAPVCEKELRSLFYVRFWSRQDIERRFPNFRFAKSTPFRDHHLLPIRKSTSSATN